MFYSVNNLYDLGNPTNTTLMFVKFPLSDQPVVTYWPEAQQNAS